MTKEEGWQRHQERVRRLLRAANPRAEASAIKAELIQEGYDQDAAERITRESWNYAKATNSGKVKK